MKTQTLLPSLLFAGTLVFVGCGDEITKTYPGTGTVCTGAAARIPGSLVYRQLSEEARKNGILRIGHPGGVILVDAVAEDAAGTKFSRLAYERTARRIMEGTCYVKNDRL